MSAPSAVHQITPPSTTGVAREALDTDPSARMRSRVVIQGNERVDRLIYRNMQQDMLRSRLPRQPARAPGATARQSGDQVLKLLPNWTPAAWGWVAGTYCYYDPDWGTKSRHVIYLALASINRHLDFIKDFGTNYTTITGGHLSTTCIRNLVSASDMLAGYLHIEKANLAKGVRGFTIPGSVTIQLDQKFVSGVANTWYNGATSGTSCEGGSSLTTNGFCECDIAYLSSVIVHETCHSCLLDEAPAHALKNYYNYRFAQYYQCKGYTMSSTYCCGKDLPLTESWWNSEYAAGLPNVPDRLPVWTSSINDYLLGSCG